MEFDSLRLVKREAGFPNSRRALIGLTNYDALMTHPTTKNIKNIFPGIDSKYYNKTVVSL